MAGLSAARSLQDQGIQVTVFEKARGPGGRMATRRSGGHMFDHGAQYFTVSDPRFGAVVEDLRTQGLVDRWPGAIGVSESGAIRPASAGTERLVAVPRMSAITRHLSNDLDVVTESLVTGARRVNDSWMLDVAGSEAGPFDALIVTNPPEQAVPLVGASPQLTEEAQRATMEPCWAMMLVFDQPLPVDYDGVFINRGPLSWAARNNSKPGRPPEEAWVVHASPEWSRTHLELEGGVIVSQLLPELFQALAINARVPSVAMAHRWRFARAKNALAAPCFWDDERRLAIAGDWVHGGNVEGAYMSGLAAAGKVSSWIAVLSSRTE